MDRKKRLYHILKIALALLIAGLFYAWLVITTGWKIPCVFYTVTGWLCPGCGITRMCIALLQGDILSAMQYNIGLTLLSPLFAVLAGSFLWRYVFFGTVKLTKIQEGCIWAAVVFLLLFAVVRNLM